MPPAPPARAGALPALHGGRILTVLRVTGAAIWSASLTLLWALVNLLLLPIPRSRVRWRHRVVRTWARGIAWMIAVSYTHLTLSTIYSV